ncbi:bifunctional diaminohydroxyphosphoribosylaminopyrimidine deaminase/5-amino-6-(5-phosphoribosylamino)uracil reductase RibD [Winogradskyella sp. A3E31]|uniref:bifunctional diaminohydroxyphosphoribosylaminopyrimidine deaminase/5-amino-6-(5-phosphoribosylamino)uracil reductase RibD n=1 Tax=Winogradskyella sp. A3E31 TaxID=3349637 RepID=UPI00398AD991
MVVKDHLLFMSRALQIANYGLGTTRPNPMVGSVITYKDKIIGEGYTSPYGGPHAEVNAIHSVEDKSLLKKAVLYVTLEPCSHYGKTPPCSDLIIEHQIPKVVIGCLDDNPKVSGKGIKKLKAAGIDVTVGILENQCKAHHKRFFTFHNKKRPYIILKWAESADGFIAPENRTEKAPVWITNTYSRQLVHKWRTEEQAILVGTNTVLMDNPSLTARDWKGNNPTRIVLDQNSKVNKSHKVINDEADTLIVDRNTIDWSGNKTIASQISSFLYQKHINSVIIEGGSKTLQTFIDQGLWDEARVFYGSNTFKKGTKAPLFSGKLSNETRVESDILRIYVND